MLKKYYRCSTNHRRDCHAITAAALPIRKEPIDKGGSEPNNSNHCTRAVYQNAMVNVPVAIKPFSFAGQSSTYCCSEPTIKDIACRKNNCNDEEICYFTISQEICVEVPVHFGAKVSVGDSLIECGETLTEGCSDDCIPDEECEE